MGTVKLRVHHRNIASLLSYDSWDLENNEESETLPNNKEIIPKGRFARKEHASSEAEENSYLPRYTFLTVDM